MKAIIANNIDGRFFKLAIISVRANGSFSVPSKMQGQMSSVLAHRGVSFLMKESAANDVDLSAGSTKIRVTRIG